MELAKLADWIRARLLDFLPDWLDFIPESWPNLALVFVAPTVILVVVGLALERIFEVYKKSKKGLQDAGKLARGKSIEDPSPATQEGQAAIQRELEKARAESAAMRAKVDAILAAVSLPAGAASLGVEAEAAKKSAVVKLVADAAPAAQQAARGLAKGDMAAGFDVLEREARAAEAEAAAKWRRLGALATGVDTTRARAAYEEAFRLHPDDFWTCIELGRLRSQAGDLRAAGEAARAAERVVRSERERFVADIALGVVLVQAGDLAGAKARFEESLKVREHLAQQNPGSAEAQRDVWVSMWRLANMEGGGVTWVQVLERMEVMKAHGALLPTDEPFLKEARTLAGQHA